MKINKRKVLYAAGLLAAVLLGALVYHLLWGKLFPYSSVILGFDKRELAHVVLYIQKGDPYTDFDWVDSVPAGVEKFHDLKFKSKPKLFFFADKGTYARRSMSKARFCAFYNGAIVVSPWAQAENAEGKISMRIYLTHELSHSLLWQNASWLAYLTVPKWLMEGIATYSADMMGTGFYPSQAETYALMKKGNWLPPALYETKAEKDIRLDVKYRVTFFYSEFACIVEDLIGRFGKEKFLGYMKALLRARRHDAVFKECFGVDFNGYLEDFRKRALAQ
jgi:hypothetical protein